jgi:hypothetical protein
LPAVRPASIRRLLYSAGQIECFLDLHQRETGRDAGTIAGMQFILDGGATS